MPVRVSHRPYPMLDLPCPFVGRQVEYREYSHTQLPALRPAVIRTHSTQSSLQVCQAFRLDCNRAPRPDSSTICPAFRPDYNTGAGPLASRRRSVAVVVDAMPMPPRRFE